MSDRFDFRPALRIRTLVIRRAALAFAVLFAVAVAVPVAGASSADAATSRWTWTSSVKVPHYDPSGSGNVSCPTSAFCMAADANRVSWSTNPKSAKSWSSAELEPLTSPYLVGGDVALEAVDCVSASFCAAVDNMGQVFTSSNPTGGASAWTATTLSDDTVAELTAVSCASPTACVAVGYSGAAFTLTPGGWQRGQLSTRQGADFSAASCASATLCAAVVADGNIYTIDPSVGGAWKRTKVGKVPHGGWDSIDCPSATTCVAVGNYNSTGVVAVTKSASKGSWKSGKITGATGGFGLVACKSASFCVIGGGGKNYWSTKLSAKTSAWHYFAPKTANSEVVAACLSTKECLIGDIGGKLHFGHRK